MSRSSVHPWLAAGLLALACWSEAPPSNLLIVVIDTLRADHTSVHGYGRDTTPNLRRLAREGIVFDAAYAPASTTGPSIASLFTSLYPSEHAVVKNGQRLASEHLTLAEIARSADFQTAAFVSSYVLDDKFGFGQGFELYDDTFSREAETHPVDEWEGEAIEVGFDRRADETTRAALRWLDEDRDPERPFLLFVHYFDPHAPYVPPDGFADRFQSQSTPDETSGELEATIRTYDGEIAFADAELGRLLGGLREAALGQRTVVAVLGDHGEGLGDHGVSKHGVHIYEAFVRVPWVVRIPDRTAAGTRIATPVSLVDALPTLLELARIEGPRNDGHGRSLVAALRGDATAPQAPIFFHRRHYEPGEIEGIAVDGEQFGVRVGAWKYLEAPKQQRVELYDLTSDPGERFNRAEELPTKALQLRSLLGSWLARADRPLIAPLPEKDRHGLEALGYVE